MPRPRAALRAASLTTLCLTTACGGAAAGAGTPQPLHLPVAVAADTLPPTPADADAVARLVKSYLRLRPAGRAPNAHWRRDEQARFAHFDLAGGWTYGNRDFRLRYGAWRVEVEPSAPGAEPGVLEAAIHFQPRDPARDRPVSVRLFARRVDGEWRLGGALPQLTRRWPEYTAGAITFRTQPGIVPDTARFDAAARWVDSLARAFAARPPRDLLYVQVRSSDDAFEVLGVAGRMPPIGGRFHGTNRFILSTGGRRDPHFWHELGHAVFREVADGRPYLRVVNEGAAEWMEWQMEPGDEAQARRVARSYHLRHPGGTVDHVASMQRDVEVHAFYATAGWLVKRTYDGGGVRAVRELLHTRPDAGEVLAVVRRHARLSRKGLDSAWRAWAQGTDIVPAGTPLRADGTRSD